VGRKHALADLESRRRANVSKATCSRLTNVNTPMTAKAEDLPVSPVLSIGLSSSLADITFDANFGSTSVSFRARPWSGLPCREIRTLA